MLCKSVAAVDGLRAGDDDDHDDVVMAAVLVMAMIGPNAKRRWQTVLSSARVLAEERACNGIGMCMESLAAVLAEAEMINPMVETKP